MLPFTPLFIDGKQVPASDGKTFEIKNPFSNQVVGTCASATSEDCQNAILAAGKAFKTWEHSTLGERRAIFLRAAELLKLEKYKSSIAVSVTEETAAAPALASINWGSSLALLTEAVTLTNELDGISFPSKVKGGMVAVERRAMGVILATAPWNAPVNLTLRSCLIPILCGNTVVFRSSEISPRSQFIVVELFQEAGLPAGVFNFISTSREDAPHLTAQIIAHPLFTGSDRVGRAIAMEAAKHLKPCVLELGGKAPVVVLEDADINEAAKAIVSSALLHSGQICMSTERVIAQRAVFDRLQEAVWSAENVLAMIQEAQSAGAQVLVGDLGRNGSLVQPHVVTNVRPGMRLWDRETFGPVVVIVPADSLDEAVELANASDYSLSAGLWTSNIYLAKEISSRIHSGYVNINGPTVHSEVSYGLVGLGGSSGYGRFSIPDFTDQRVTVTHPLGASYPILD
ncbi:hypothetical protein D9757_002580 [Collybiopsis confluens]|uniref:Aldehyde dehydrogenase domain-containing protein n=1 Tax=Collybiopsis confluens TaxID=2823264 RepID=A0A8H5HW96_9AGAR|nr:hypothetical protein D9757_002580 [Collybiopsis confluens]